MASGILGQASPAAATNTTVYTVPALVTATFNISVANTSASIVVVNVAVAGTGTPSASEFLEYQTIIPPFSVLERGGIVAQTGENVVVNASGSGCAVSVYGFEQ
jgi:hypothetical protein